MTVKTAAPQQTTTPAAPATPPPEQNFDDSWDELSRDAGQTTSPPTTPTEPAPATGAAAPAATGAAPAGEAGDEPAPAAQTPAAPAGQTQTTAQTPEDLWANLSPEQRSALADLNARLSDAEHRAASDAARVGAFQRKVDDLMRAQRATGVPASAQPTAQQVQQAMQSPEGWEELKKDYPSIAGPIEAAMNALRTQTLEAARREVQQITQPLLQAQSQVNERFALEEQNRQRAFRTEQVRALAEAYPDFAQVKESAEFKGWLAQQTPMVQAGIKSQYASDAIQILDLYNAAKTGNTVADLTLKRKTRQQQAVTTPGGSGRAAISRSAEIPDEFGAAWDALSRQSAGGQKR